MIYCVSVLSLFLCDSGQSHQETEGIGGDHTLDHLMDPEAAVQAGVIAGVTAVAQGTLDDLTGQAWLNVR